MATPLLDDTQFPLGYCAVCAREVMTYLEADDGEVESRRCLHCDELLADWRHATSDEIESAGYSLVEARACGNGGGCSSGCGMRR